MSLRNRDPEPKSKIMIVDDTPANLNLLEEILQMRQHEVRSFPLGRLALAAAAREAPDLVLLDVNMPEMNGYEVCEHLKADAHLADIPVIFISALDETANKVRGFQSGAADYISKPFQIEEVQARVETHLSLRRSRKAERELLEKTLSGAITTLLELLQLTAPALVLRSHSLRDIVRWIVTKLRLENSWQYELAAALSLIGCISHPNELFEKAYGCQELTAEEAQIFREHPEVGARLLANIPRLEVVADIIRHQQTPDAEHSMSEQARQGAHMLNLALSLDQRLYRDVPIDEALIRLKNLNRFNNVMLKALAGYHPSVTEFDVRQIPIQDVCSGMILDEDIATVNNNMLIFKTGTVFTNLWIERLKNFVKTQGIQKRVRVRIPKFAALEKALEASSGTPKV